MGLLSRRRAAGASRISALAKSLEDYRDNVNFFRAGSVEGATDDGINGLFRKLRDEECGRITAELDGLAGAVRGQKRGGHLSPSRVGSREAELSRLHQKLVRVIATDFFGAPKRAAAAASLERCREALRLSQSHDRRLVRQAAVICDGLYEYPGRKGARGERDEGSGNAGRRAKRGGRSGRK